MAAKGGVAGVVGAAKEGVSGVAGAAKGGTAGVGVAVAVVVVVTGGAAGATDRGVARWTGGRGAPPTPHPAPDTSTSVTSRHPPVT
ncbi:hypothetical protein, partial [Streptomyces tendae]